MKELTIKEKAQRYDEAIKKIKYVMEHGVQPVLNKEDLQGIFPELQESEDERIRKTLIDFFNRGAENGAQTNGVYDKDILAWLEKLKVFAKHGYGLYYFASNGFAYVDNPTGDNVSWLEKQGDKSQGKSAFEAIKEEKVDNANKVEPKFHEGEWIAHEGLNTAKIISIEGDRYEVEFIDGNKDFAHIDYIDRIFHLWTIADAKDGDVLAVNNEVFVYAHRKQLYSIAIAHCFVDSAGVFYLDGEFGFTEKGNSVHPATKSQRDVLMKAMADSGYEWDVKKKELKKIGQKPLQWNILDYKTWQYIVSDVLTKHNGIGQYLDDGFCKKIAQGMQEEWSKKLSLGQNPTWHAEDEKNLNAVLSFIGDEYLRRWLKDIIHKEYDEPIEWSEEDECYMTECINAIATKDGWSFEEKRKTKHWLESLKQRIGG